MPRNLNRRTPKSRFLNNIAGLLIGLAFAGCQSEGGSAGPGGSGGSAAGGAGGAGVSTGGAGGNGGSAGGSGGTTGSGGAVSTGGAGGLAGNPGSGGASAPDSGAADLGPAPDVAMPPSDGGPARPKTVLLVTRSGGGYRHESIEPAAAAIRTALTPLGITSEISAELTPFTAAALSRFGAVVLISASGSVLGPINSPEMTAFLAYVRGGGGVMAIHAATAVSYDGASPYIQMLGGKFIGHPGNVRTTNCYPEGNHAAAAALPAMFSHRDEIYTYSNRRMDSQVVVRCDALGSNEKIPLAWYHREGDGRVFSTGLGHGTELWTANGRLLKDHVTPAILWTLGM